MSEEQPVVEPQANPEGKTTEEIMYDKSVDTPESEKEEVAEPAQAEEVTEEKVAEGDYTLTLPEETLLSDSVKDEIASIAKEQGLSNEQAQKLLDMQNETVSEYHESLDAEFKDQITTWGEEIKADKELGGDNLDKNVQFARRAVTAFAGEEFLQELDETGYGNHPKLFRMLTKIGKEMEAGELVTANAQPNEPKSFAERFYPEANKDN